MTIHIVDDDDAVRTSIQFALEVAGFQVQSYVTPQDFLNRGDEDRGIVICDVGFPATTGVELARRLHKRGSLMRIILITGSPDGAVNAEAAGASVDVVLEKPVSLVTLLAEIARIQSGWA